MNKISLPKTQRTKQQPHPPHLPTLMSHPAGGQNHRPHSPHEVGAMHRCKQLLNSTHSPPTTQLRGDDSHISNPSTTSPNSHPSPQRCRHLLASAAQHTKAPSATHQEPANLPQCSHRKLSMTTKHRRRGASERSPRNGPPPSITTKPHASNHQKPTSRPSGAHKTARTPAQDTSIPATNLRRPDQLP
mgnify:CR=1 FL=1